MTYFKCLVSILVTAGVSWFEKYFLRIKLFAFRASVGVYYSVCETEFCGSRPEHQKLLRTFLITNFMQFLESLCGHIYVQEGGDVKPLSLSKYVTDTGESHFPKQLFISKESQI